MKKSYVQDMQKVNNIHEMKILANIFTLLMQWTSLELDKVHLIHGKTLLVRLLS